MLLRTRFLGGQSRVVRGFVHQSRVSYQPATHLQFRRFIASSSIMKTSSTKQGAGNGSKPVSTANSENRKRNNFPARRRDRPQLDVTPQYTDYWDRAKVDEGVAKGFVALGSFHLLPNSRKNVGFVRLQDGSSKDVYIDGLEARNRAMNGDFVAVELGPEVDKANIEEDYSSTPRLELVVPDVEKEAADDLWAPSIVTHPPSVTNKPKTANNDKQRSGKIVAVLAANSGEATSSDREFASRHVGKLQAACRRELLQVGQHLPATETFAYFVPSDTRVPKMRIQRGELPYEFTQDPLVHGDRFLYLGKISSWSASEADPSGVLFGRLGQAGEIGPETEALLMENGVDHGEFPQEALDCLKAFLPPREAGFDKPDELWWKIPSEELRNRKDLRDTLIFTIDPYTAKDIDDALHCTPLEDGTYEMGVHIADVSYFIKPGSALDAEAHRRSTSVYLVQKVIPMLPALLSEELCSLNPNVDRLAFSCIWRMKRTGEICPQHPPWFGRTIIRSACKLHYGLAQKIIDEGPGFSEWNEPGRVPEASKWTKQQVCDSLRNMHLIGMARRELRFDPQRGGALEMQTAKMSFELDKETGNPVGVKKYPMQDTNRLVEEFMLLANFLVAQRLIQSDRENAFLRHHPPPDAQEMQKMVDVLRRSSGITLFENGKISPSAIDTALKSLRARKAQDTASSSVGLLPEDSSLMIVASELLKKPMNNALYFIASELEESKWRHWALNIKYYTHFTSPIRRYADVCVHRELAWALASNPKPVLSQKERVYLRYAAQQCNEKKDASRMAQEASDNVYLNILIRDKFEKKDTLCARAVVIDLGPKSFTCFIPELGVSKRVHAEEDFNWVVLSAETLAGVLSNNNRRPRDSDNDSSKSAPRVEQDDDDEDVTDAGQDPKQEKKRRDDNDEEKTVIALRLAIPKKKMTVELKVLSELRVALVPKQHKDRRGGLDFKLVPEHAAEVPGAVPMIGEELTSLPRTRRQPSAGTTAAHRGPVVHVRTRIEEPAPSGAVKNASVRVQHHRPGSNGPKTMDGKVTVESPSHGPRKGLHPSRGGSSRVVSSVSRDGMEAGQPHSHALEATDELEVTATRGDGVIRNQRGASKTHSGAPRHPRQDQGNNSRSGQQRERSGKDETQRFRVEKDQED